MSDEEVATLATYLAERMEELTSPRLHVMELFVTHGCNLACDYCFVMSIDGAKEVHDRHRRTHSGEGSFDIIMSKLPMLKAYQGWVGVRMTIGPDTVGSLSESVQFLFQAGVNQFLIGCVDDSVWDQTALETLRKEPRSTLAFYRTMKSQGAPIRINSFDEGLAGRKERVCDLWGCGAGSTRLAVPAEGDLYPCCRFVGLDHQQDAYWLGDLSRGIVRRGRVQELADNRVNIRYPCFSCDLGAYCCGGCPAVNLQGSGSIYFPGFSQCAVNRVWVEVLQEEERTRQTGASSQVATDPVESAA